MFRLLVTIVSAIATYLTYLVLGPSTVEPVKWTPPPPPPDKPNRKLASTTRLPIGFGPEDIAVDSRGILYTGLDDGRIMRWRDGQPLEEFTNTGGRPLGIEIDGDDNLIVCDAYLGLLKVSQDGEITVLTSTNYTNNCAIARDGTIYLSESSTKFDHDHWYDDMLEHQPHGRLHAYHSSTGRLELLMDGIHFANGVALAPDESFVLVAETWEYRIRRYWLTGEKAGTNDIFVDNLLCVPDNMSLGSDGLVWVAIAQGPKTRHLMDWLAAYPKLRKIIHHMPAALRPKMKPYAMVLAFDADGNLVHDLRDPDGKAYNAITGVREHHGILYFGSIDMHEVGRFELDSLS